jgi:5-oxoprolinase (ATP-hydrolysing) subunit C
MADARFIVRQVGPQVSVQDAGRRGNMRFGVPWSGPMDRKAFAIANQAIGNAAGPAIEVSVGGLGLDCVAGEVSVAIAGGGFAADLAGEVTGSWAVRTIRAGQTLTLRAGPWGSWTYLAFAGEMATDRWLGSAATHALSGFGGGMLTAGQTITIANTRTMPRRALTCPIWARPRHQCHVVLGPQDQYFDTTPLLHAPFHLTDAYDRMGVRLRGPLLPHDALNIPSGPILRGSVQVSGDGVATVLLADHQTTGGYPKIATLLADDVDGFVQLRPRDAVRFAAVTAEQAVQMARFRARAHAEYLARMAR